MFEQFKPGLPVTDAQWEDAIRRFKRTVLPAKTTLLREGEVSKQAFIIEKGCLRAWFNQDGKDLTFRFFFEGQMVASMESFRKAIPGPVTIETIEPSIVWAISKTDLDALLEDAANTPALAKRLLDAAFERTYDYMRHCLSFIKDNPEQRYRNLLRDAPHIIQRVPQHYIASYLGISSVHLSRIKSKVAGR